MLCDPELREGRLDSEKLDVKSISMLYPEALAKLTELARETRGGIVELGAYIGGSTVALATGNQRRFRHAVIECGGSHNHPTLGSADIIADWKLNVDRFGFADAVKLVQGYGYDRAVQKAVIRHAKHIGLLFMDADGFIAPPLKAFARYMRPDCILALDDYWAPGAEEKESAVRPFVDAQIAAGRLVPISLEGGTWFGRVNGRRALKHFANMIPVRRDSGHCFLTPVANTNLCDTPENPTKSRLRLFENGRELGPAHAAHDDIRTKGGGSFSHWDSGYRRWLLWSTPDNSDPQTNGRRYEADWGRGRRSLCDV
jgi:predicted O-methyltransferase YrrM